MENKKTSFWKIGHAVSIVALIMALAVVFMATDQTITNTIIQYSAKFGMVMLAFLFAIKNIAMTHKRGENKFADFLRKQLPWQREQGLIAFNAFVLHAASVAILVLFHNRFTFSEYVYSIFTAIIPMSMMIYLFVTSQKFVQKRIKGWKKTHSVGWILFGSVLIHEYLVSQSFQLTTIIATVVAIGSILYSVIVQKVNKRSIRQVQFALLGFVLMGGMFITNMFVREPLLKFGMVEEQNTLEVKKEDAPVSTTEMTTPIKEEPTPAQTVAALFKDGQYEGSADANFGKIGLVVTVQNDKITSISVKEGSENQNYVSTLIGRVIEKQDTKVQGISGATRTTNGVKNAIDDALNKARV